MLTPVTNDIVLRLRLTDSIRAVMLASVSHCSVARDLGIAAGGHAGVARWQSLLRIRIPGRERSVLMRQTEALWLSSNVIKY